MDSKLVSNYLSLLKKKTGLSFDAIAEKSKRSESTVKKLFNGTTEDPRLDSVAPIVYAMGGSLDEMCNPGKSKDDLKEVSVVSLKEAYEYQSAIAQENNEAHISNIRAHYEQHHIDLKENFEKRLADKKELNEALKEQIKDLKKANLIKNLIISFFVVCVVTLLLLEFIHPEHGWLRF